jgi:hypothetical protein
MGQTQVSGQCDWLLWSQANGRLRSTFGNFRERCRFIQRRDGRVSHEPVLWRSFPQPSGGTGRRQSIPASRQNASRDETSHRERGLEEGDFGTGSEKKTQENRIASGSNAGQREDPSSTGLMGEGLTFHFDQGEAAGISARAAGLARH